MPAGRRGGAGAGAGPAGGGSFLEPGALEELAGAVGATGPGGAVAVDAEAKALLEQLVEHMVEEMSQAAIQLAKHRDGDRLEARDLLLHVNRAWQIPLPGQGGGTVRVFKRPAAVGQTQERKKVARQMQLGTHDAAGAAAKK